MTGFGFIHVCAGMLRSVQGSGWGLGFVPRRPICAQILVFHYFTASAHKFDFDSPAPSANVVVSGVRCVTDNLNAKHTKMAVHALVRTHNID